MNEITYMTKLWQGDLDALKRHSQADVIIVNNLKPKLVQIGNTDDPYFEPEMKAVKACKTKYILWYSADVVPPNTDWVTEALPLLDEYPIVSPFWEDNYEDYVRMAKAQDRGLFDETGFGFADQFFSDQAYIALASVMKKVDYTIDHPIKRWYPEHGGNSFERRVAQWLAHSNQKRAVLRNHRYRHITKEHK